MAAGLIPEAIMSHLAPLKALQPTTLIGFSILFFAALNALTELVLGVIWSPKSYVSLTRGDRAEFRSRVVAAIHAVLLTVGPLHTLLSEPSLFTDVVDSPSEWGDVWCYAFGGYMLYDTGHTILFLENATIADYLHHTFSFGAVLVRWYTGKIMVIGLSALITMEVTNPSLHLIWILRKVGLGESRWFLYNAYLFVLLYFVFRIVMCGYLMYFFTNDLYTRDLLMSPLSIGLLVFGFLTGLSYFWFVKIIKLAGKAQTKVAAAEARAKKD